MRDVMLAILVKAQTQRPNKNQFVNGELEWITYERRVMFEVVNTERRKRGKKPVSIADVEQAERCASGHCDYSSKFALYCAELVNES